jgi:hypothetical protein
MSELEMVTVLKYVCKKRLVTTEDFNMCCGYSDMCGV